jgi:signal recognition particle receptor subunit beta
MAVLDLERNVIVLRVVYDGPPEAGKTTSLRALATSLGQPLYSPEESGGRTLYFDWMDYTAGRFEGYRIRCQIVSVPGQKFLASRRRRLLEEADVIVFVADTTRRCFAETAAHLQELAPIAAGLGPPEVGVIVQANKRDQPDAVPILEVKQLIARTGWNAGIVESIAAEGAGIRETFVFAVRLALDRVREQMRTGSLPIGAPELDDGLALREWIEAAEQREAGSIAEEAPPRPPDVSAPAGAIWPPVEGRLILHEASAGGWTARRLPNGDCETIGGTGWRAFSRREAEYIDLEQGRAALIDWARLHAACAGILSPRRCVVLADAGDGRWRLWQILRPERSLRDLLEGLERRAADEAAVRLLEVATALFEMELKISHAICQVPCTLDTIGWVDGKAAYIGLMPDEPSLSPIARQGAALVRGELWPVLERKLSNRRGEIAGAVSRARSYTIAPQTAELVSEMLAGRA